MRTVRIVNNEEIKEIISQCRTCFLGMSGTDGQPYVVPMNFGYTGDEFILHSAPEGRMIDLLKENPKVCITLCLGDDLAFMHENMACSYRVKSKSIVATGSITFIDEIDKKEECLHLLMKQYSQRTFKFGEPALKNVCIMRMKIDEITAREFGAPASSNWVR